MRGWPPLEAFLVALAFGLALLPLRAFVTSEPDVAPLEVESTAAEPTDEDLVFLTAKFVHPPLRFTVSHLGQPIWTVEEGGDQTEFLGEAMLNIPEEGIDLLVEAEWPDGTARTAVELILEPETRNLRSGTVWGEGNLVEAATFVW